ncbi:MAG TPA: putative molybdenum carrier protein [Kofleriaceae bacterium]
MLVILHSGQTGVERGAHFAAIARGITVAGFMPLDARDELGPIPPEVAESLTSCFDRGPRPSVRANIALASGVLLVVPNAAAPHRFTAMDAVMQWIRTARVPSLIADATMNVDTAARWAASLPETCGSVRILVTGPRGTRWTDGESVGRRLVAALAFSDSARSHGPTESSTQSG